MTEYIQFFMAHSLLFIALLVVLVLLIANEVHAQWSAASRCSSQKLVQMMNHDQASVIDIREKTDYRAGKIIGSKNIPSTDLLKKINELDKSKTVVLVCGNGQQSQKQAQALKKQGLNVYYLGGGITAWRNDNMPLDK
ncbi:MAG: rhodanese-like domain-containing protein [Legionellales bacterium]|nr:rhodanese-like domain-containing protein [Legionellales bacterium]